jgi:hypothetical protein
MTTIDHDRSFFAIRHRDGTLIENSETSLEGVVEFLTEYPETASDVVAVYELTPAQERCKNVTKAVRDLLRDAISGADEDRGQDAILSWTISALNVALGEASYLEEQAIRQSQRRAA